MRFSLLSLIAFTVVCGAGMMCWTANWDAWQVKWRIDWPVVQNEESTFPEERVTFRYSNVVMDPTERTLAIPIEEYKNHQWNSCTRVVSTDTGEEIARLKGELSPYRSSQCMCFSADGSRLLIVPENVFTKITYWDVARGEILWSAEGSGNQCCVSKNESFALVAYTNGVLVLNVKTGELIHSIVSESMPIFSPGGEWVVIMNGGKSELISARTGRKVCVLPIEFYSSRSGFINDTTIVDMVPIYSDPTHGQKAGVYITTYSLIEDRLNTVDIFFVEHVEEFGEFLLRQGMLLYKSGIDSKQQPIVKIFDIASRTFLGTVDAQCGGVSSDFKRFVSAGPTLDVYHLPDGAKEKMGAQSETRQSVGNNGDSPFGRQSFVPQKLTHREKRILRCEPNALVMWEKRYPEDWTRYLLNPVAWAMAAALLFFGWNLRRGWGAKQGEMKQA